MSRMTTSCASLSWAMPAMRRACSSGVRAGMLAAVEAKSLDQFSDRRGNETFDRLAARDTVADASRRDRQGLDLEEQDALWPLEVGEHLVELIARIAGPCSNCKSRVLEDRVRLL